MEKELATHSSVLALRKERLKKGKKVGEGLPNCRNTLRDALIENVKWFRILEYESTEMEWRDKKVETSAEADVRGSICQIKQIIFHLEENMEP